MESPFSTVGCGFREMQTDGLKGHPLRAQEEAGGRHRAFSAWSAQWSLL